MDIVIILALLLYMLSAAGYFAFLFFQKNYLHRAGYFLILAGFVCHTLTIVYAFVNSGQIPVRNLHETLSVAGWVAAGFFLIFQYKFKMRILGIYAAPLVAVIMVAVSQVPNQPVEAQSIFKSFWLFSHILAIFVGEAASGYYTFFRKMPLKPKAPVSFSSAYRLWICSTIPGMSVLSSVLRWLPSA
jgi:ABC-type transport system involved in cytochrome c biogenesis permease subunit